MIWQIRTTTSDDKCIFRAFAKHIRQSARTLLQSYRGTGLSAQLLRPSNRPQKSFTSLITRAYACIRVLACRSTTKVVLSSLTNHAYYVSSCSVFTAKDSQHCTSRRTHEDTLFTAGSYFSSALTFQASPALTILIPLRN